MVKERQAKEAKKARKGGALEALVPSETFEQLMEPEPGYVAPELVDGHLSRTRMATAYHLSGFYCSPEAPEGATPRVRPLVPTASATAALLASALRRRRSLGGAAQ